MKTNKINLYRKLERRFTVFRWLLILIVAPVTLSFSDYRKNQLGYLIVMIFCAIYNLCLTYITYGKNERLMKLLKYTFYLDIPMISFILYVRGGLRSDIFLLYFLIILYNGAKYGYSGTFGSLGQCLFYFTIASLLATPIDEMDWNRYIIRVIYLIILSVVMYEVNRQITESHSKERKARELAYRDPLTKLHNRLLMSEYFEKLRTQYEQTGQTFSIVLLDIDNFKRVNDTRGHAFGDRVLQAFAYLVAECISNDDFLCRFGGEEFLVFFANTDRSNIFEKVDMIRREVEEYDFFGENITVSIGINIFKNNYTMIENISLADEAMYAVKNTGKNKVLMYEDLAFSLNRM